MAGRGPRKKQEWKKRVQEQERKVLDEGHPRSQGSQKITIGWGHWTILDIRVIRAGWLHPVRSRLPYVTCQNRTSGRAVPQDMLESVFPGGWGWRYSQAPRSPGLDQCTRDIDHALTPPDQWPTGTVALDMIVRPSSENYQRFFPNA